MTVHRGAGLNNFHKSCVIVQSKIVLSLTTYRKQHIYLSPILLKDLETFQTLQTNCWNISMMLKSPMRR